jgi:hypothetical protein
MFESGWAVKVAQAHALLAEAAAAIDSDVTGAAAAIGLPDVLAAVRQGELATCRLVERVDRSGEYAVDGDASTTAYVRGICHERGRWVARRLQLGRVLSDRLPATGKAWLSGDLGLEHAEVIAQATGDLPTSSSPPRSKRFWPGRRPG